VLCLRAGTPEWWGAYTEFWDATYRLIVVHYFLLRYFRETVFLSTMSAFMKSAATAKAMSMKKPVNNVLLPNISHKI